MTHGVPCFTTFCSAEEALGRTQSGGAGQLCSVQPSDNATQNCQANFTCVPLPDLVMHRGSPALALVNPHCLAVILTKKTVL